MSKYTRENYEIYQKSCDLANTFNVLKYLSDWAIEQSEEYKKVMDSENPAGAYLLLKDELPLPGLKQSDMLELLLAVDKINVKFS